MIRLIGFGVVIFGLVLAILGLILLAVSNFMYFTRTKDAKFQQFWLSKEALTPTEYWLNRGGLGFCILGLLLMMVFTCIAVSVGSG